MRDSSGWERLRGQERATVDGKVLSWRMDSADYGQY